MADWLTDFVAHTSYGEAPENIMWWVGVSTIAGALRRKVWIDEKLYQHTPNFYILLIGPPGILKKSTSLSLGMRMLRRIEGIDFGPDTITWEQLVTHMSDAYQTYTVNGEKYEASCVTIELGEFDTLFDPGNRALASQLTRMYDAPDRFDKETKTNGSDHIIRPWLNICACTTPDWMEKNFSEKFIGTGFASRVNFVFCDKTKRVSHPGRRMKPVGYQEEENRLVNWLGEIAELSGEFKMTDAAYEWSDAWYERYRDFLEEECEQSEMGLYSRKQTHLLRMAMVLSASRGKFPAIDVAELIDADRIMETASQSIARVFGKVGQGPVSKLAMEIVEWLVKDGKMRKWTLFDKRFYRRVSDKDFEAALKSAVLAGRVKEVGDMRDPILELV